MVNKHEELRRRTKQFALRTLRLFRSSIRSEEGRILGRQSLRAATSVAANYRAAGRARPRAEFIAKIGIIVEEIDEVVFWLELIADGELMARSRWVPLQKEAGELLALFAASHHTVKTRCTKPKAFDEPPAR